MDAVALAAAVRSGELSAAEVTAAAVAAIEALDPHLNAFVLKDFPRARETASRVPRDAPLAGVPFAVKDIDVYTQEWPTTHSSRFFDGAPPRADSEIVGRWRAAGTVFLGKTNTPEFAAEFATEPVFRGVTHNPWDLNAIVGGSSGGAAAAVASGMLPVAHGSDVGGSIRVPAACCGLFGLKPSRGLNPVGPHYGELGGNMDCEHVLTRSVRDSAAFLDATAGPEPGAPYRVERSVPSYLAALGAPVGRLRVVSLRAGIDGARVEPEILEKLDAAAALLTAQGHAVEEGRFPAELAALSAGEGWSMLWLMDVAALIQERARELGRPPGPGELEPLSAYIMRFIDGKSALDYLAAKRVAQRCALSMMRAFDAFDLILTPSIAETPPPVGSFAAQAPGTTYEKWAARAYAFAPFSEIFNVTGQPTASLPLFQSAAGMPIGIQIAGRQNQDHVVLQVAAALEEATGWTRRHPPLWAGALA